MNRTTGLPKQTGCVLNDKINNIWKAQEHTYSFLQSLFSFGSKQGCHGNISMCTACVLGGTLQTVLLGGAQ